MQILRFLAYFFAVSYCFFLKSYGQGTPPWQNSLLIASSADGINFSTPTIFQDSSGVPSVVRWKGDTLVCAFQWFRQPMQASSWDRVAIKFSYNNGQTWTTPTPISINNFPTNYQRPFDPTLAVVDKNKLRIYFSSSDGMPIGGLTNIVDTYSAISTDGIRYTFEPKARFDSPSTPVIDPAVLFFSNKWHYAAPKGSPQAGAYHATSTDGLIFVQEIDYISDATHNWTGNLMLENQTTMRFYGSGQKIWFNTTNDGFTWQGYTNTNLSEGGDPSVCKISSNNYIVIYVGTANKITANEDEILKNLVKAYPNPTESILKIELQNIQVNSFQLYDLKGIILKQGMLSEDQTIDVENLQSGMYYLALNTNSAKIYLKVVKK